MISGQKNGSTEAVRKVIKQATHPLTIGQIRGNPNLEWYSEKQVMTALKTLTGQGQVVKEGEGEDATYGKRKPVVLKPLVMEFRVLKRDLFENWRLCERDPYETTRSAVFSSMGRA